MHSFQTPYHLLASSQSGSFSSSTLDVSLKSSAASVSPSLTTTVSSKEASDVPATSPRQRIVSHESQYGVPLSSEVRETLFGHAHPSTPGNSDLQRSRSQPQRRAVRWAAKECLPDSIFEEFKPQPSTAPLFQRGHGASRSMGALESTSGSLSPVLRPSRRISMDNYENAGFSDGATSSTNGPWFKKLFRSKSTHASRSTSPGAKAPATGGIYELYRQSAADGYAFCTDNGAQTCEVLHVRTPHVLRGWKATLTLPSSAAPIISLRRRHAFDTSMTFTDGSESISLCQKVSSQPELEFNSLHHGETLYWQRRVRDGALLLSSHQYGTTRAVYRPASEQGRKLGKLEILTSRDRRDVTFVFAAATLFAYLALLGGPDRIAGHPATSSERALPALPPKQSGHQRSRSTRKPVTDLQARSIGIAV